MKAGVRDYMAKERRQERRGKRESLGRGILRSGESLVLTDLGEDYLAKGLFESPTPFRNLLLTIRGQAPVRASDLIDRWGSSNIRLLGRALQEGYVETVGPEAGPGEVDWADVARQFRESGGV